MFYIKIFPHTPCDFVDFLDLILTPCIKQYYDKLDTILDFSCSFFIFMHTEITLACVGRDHDNSFFLAEFATDLKRCHTGGS